MAYASINPYTGDHIKTFSNVSDHEVKQALKDGDAAFKKWRETQFKERADLLNSIAKQLRQDIDELAKMATIEMGKLFSEAKAEVILSAEICEYYAQNAEEILKPQPLKIKSSQGGTPHISFQPMGIVFAIEPWNFPYYQVIRIVAPQLAAGNAVILKHASNLPQCAALFEKTLSKAGVPHGLFKNLYTARHHTEMILQDPRVCGLALTGSESAGKVIAATAGKALKKTTMELGGADAFIVLDDVDLEKAVKWAVYGRHWNAGQVCVSAKRIIVHERIYDRFLALYKEGVAQLKPGDPMDPETTLAPLSSEDAVSDLRGQVEDAIDAGSVAEEIGQPVPQKGAFFRPVLLTNLHQNNPARHWEFFGPVTQLYRAKDDDDAIKIANDSPYGLGGSVFSKDIDRAQYVASKINTGMVFINHPTSVKADLPFGGIKNSGYGRELIDLGIKEFVNHKLINIVDIDAPF